MQYHPEAAAGPHDAEYLFDQFVDLMAGETRMMPRLAASVRMSAVARACRTADTHARGGRRVMPRRDDLNHVLVIGSGPIVIGQACEFDYSGTQACRVLRAEGLQVSLVNSNPATIMTDPEYADHTYVEPITPAFVEKVIAQQAERGNKIDALLATLGGQTALNTAVALYENGVLERYGVELIGADFEAIQRGEDRQRFKDIVAKVGGESAPLPGVFHHGRGPRDRRGPRAAGRGAAVVHDGRARLGHGVLRRGRRADGRRRAGRLARAPTC